MFKKPLEIFCRFFILGLYSFGGPVAHLGYFRKHFVEKLKWIDDQAYGRIIALSQLLPGPGSSQTGFGIGVHHGGVLGGFAAFFGFTLPSFIILYFLASSNFSGDAGSVQAGIIHGLKLLAVVVVADAILKMGEKFCSALWGQILAVLTAGALLLYPNILVQFIALAVAAIYGIACVRVDGEDTQERVKVKWFPTLLFIILFIALPVIANRHALLQIVSTFYHTGSLVFGGGHVVLPILQNFMGDAISQDRFLLGYASAQGIPGPMFTLATFLGAELYQSNQFLGALVATLAIFFPGFLLMLGLQGTWESLGKKKRIAGASAAINAAVVGLLISAFYNPVFVSAVATPRDMAFVVIGYGVLRFLKAPMIVMVTSFAVLGWLAY